jgi:2-dehydropantoate 2-reductase
MTPGGLKVAVLGPGGVGGFLAAVLAREGSSVLVLAGDETSRGLAEHGLRLESRRFGDFEVAVRSAARLSEAVHACLITVKATQLAEAVDRIPADALGQALVIPFLNGIDHIGFLRGKYPATSVVAATIRIETTKAGPGLIRQTSPFAAIDIAPSDANRERVEPLVEHLQATGLDVRVRADESAMLWDKLALLAPMALLTTQARATVGVVRSERRAETVALIGEVAAVAQTEGVRIDPEAVLRQMDSVPESMETSMQRDQAAGRPLELDALGRALLRRAAKAGIEVPVTRRLVDELQSRSEPSASTLNSS